jgi:serine protease
MSLPRFRAGARTALAVFGAVTLLALPESPRTANAAQRQGLGPAVPRDPQARSGLRRSPARARALIEARARRLDYVPGEVIVKFRDGLAPVRRQRALTALRSRPSVSDLEWHREVALLYDATEPDARLLAQQLSAQPEVEYAEPNYLMRIRPVGNRVPLDAGEAHPALTPNDPAYTAQWNLSALDMPHAWDINPGGSSSVVVAIVDTGVTTVNQNFNFPYWNGSAIQTISMPFGISPGLPSSRHTRPRDFAFWDGAVFDTDGHGTHVASTVAESTNDMSRAAGIAYNTVIMPVKVCTGFWDEQIIRSSLGFTGRADNDDAGCSILDVADGIEYAAEQGAKVINLSLGSEGASNLMRNAVDSAVRRGAFVAIAMGNLFEDGNPTVYPAKDAELIQGAMSVAAVGRSLGTRASYSGTGSHCEIAAPGGDLDDYIFQTTVAEPSHTSLAPNFSQYGVFGIQGTSMATPHVAGLAALIISQRPGVTPAQVESIIRATAKDIGAPGKDNEFGYGLIQPRAALFGLGIRK